jgi:FkbM family methyltransferase
MPIRLREVIFDIVSRLPQPLCHWLYAQGWLRSRLASILKYGVPANWLDDRYEAETIAMLREDARPAAVVADIGAHIGFESLVLARLVGESGTVLSFEPDPTNLARLRQNLKINSITNVRLIDRAVSKSTGIHLFDAQGSTTSHLVSGKVDARGGETMQVQTVSLDDFFYDEHAPIPSLLKIDVEGHELAVLEGGERFLAQFKPALLLEMHAEQSMLKCLRLLMPIGYKFKLLEKPDHDLATTACQGKTNFNFFICHVAAVSDPRPIRCG